MRSYRTAALAALAGAVLLAGCGSDSNNAEPPEFDPEPTASSAAPSPTESAASDEPTASSAAPSPTESATSDEPVDGKVLRGSSAAATPDETVVADVWYAYWTELYRMYSTTEVHRDALYRVAADDAASGPLDYVASMQNGEVHQVGGAIAAVTTVEVTGDRAVLESCFRNSALNVDDRGTPVEPLLVWFTTEDVLEKEGPGWRVTENITTSRNSKCEFR